MDKNTLNKMYLSSNKNIQQAHKEISLALQDTFDTTLEQSATMGYGSLKYGLSNKKSQEFILEEVQNRAKTKKKLADDITIRAIVSASFNTAKNTLRTVQTIYPNIPTKITLERVGLEEGATILFTWNNNGPTRRIENT
jgi:hypothetical protein